MLAKIFATSSQLIVNEPAESRRKSRMVDHSIGRREFLSGLLGATSLAGAQSQRPPNIILILTDDQGWGDVGIHGNKDIETPAMNRLAAESVEFTHFYVSPVCAPTRASLM